MKVVGITQARTGSVRFPKKLLEKIGNESLLEIHIKRLKKSKLLDTIIIATTNKTEDDKVASISSDLNIKCFRGSENDVLDRYYKAATKVQPAAIARFTADCPLIDPFLIDEVIKHFLNKKLDYYSNALQETYPDGQDIEVFTFASLKKAWKEAKILSDREHVTPYIKNNSDFLGGNIFKSSNHDAEGTYGNVRMTVDEKKDLEVIKILINELGFDQKWEKYAEHYLKHPRIHSINSSIKRNEGYEKSLHKDS
jgi:spore coat polysaccharide biosynthesis protein SpsF